VIRIALITSCSCRILSHTIKETLTSWAIQGMLSLPGAIYFRAVTGATSAGRLYY
jgi:hypothetical protein